MKRTTQQLINKAIDDLNESEQDWYSDQPDTILTRTCPDAYTFEGYIKALLDVELINFGEKLNVISTYRNRNKGRMPHITISGKAERKSKCDI